MVATHFQRGLLLHSTQMLFPTFKLNLAVKMDLG